MSFKKYIIKKVKSIMVPFWVFAMMAVVVTCVYCNYDSYYLEHMLKEIGNGVIRNTFPAASLWFLTCLFVMQIMFFFIKKIKFKPLIIVVGLLMYIYSLYGLNPSPLWYPTMPYNVDSALYYMVYYAIGYCVFPYAVKLFALDSTQKKIGFWMSGSIAVIYAINVYFGVDMYSMLPFAGDIIAVLPILSSCTIIWAFFVIARIIEDVKVLSDMGRNSLYLCGCEYIVKTLATCFFGIIGFNLVLPNPLSVYIYAAILLVFANKYIVPIEKYILKKIVKE